MSSSISVVIPFYHAEEYFEETYNSIVSQTLQAKEVIVVIDGCGPKAEAFLTKFPNLTVISLPENVGPAKARNIGVDKASGEYIAFIDADDKWASDKLEKQLAFLIKNPNYSVCHTGIKVFNKDKIITEYTNKPTHLTMEELLITGHALPTSLLFKKSAFEHINGFDTSMQCSEDHDFLIRLEEANEHIIFLPEALSLLRREGHGNLSSNGRKLLIGRKQMLVKHKALYKLHPNSRNEFIYKTLMTVGGKSKGIEQKIYFLLAKVSKFCLKFTSK